MEPRKEPLVRPQFLRRLSLGLGCLSAVCIVLMFLALTDIYHGEADLSLEWRIVQVALVAMVAFHIAAFAALMVSRKQ